MPQAHYLKEELAQLIQTDPAIWQFVQESSLDGIWYWDLEHPDQEWMSPEMWRLFGVDPATKQHDPAEWQDLIHPDDLQVALENFQAHCADPDHPYDQIVRYRHADGSTVWVRCRGLAIRDADGRPRRMLGAHNDLTAVKQAEEAARAGKAEAERANDELRAFSYALSHELKAPANTVLMLLTELSESMGGQAGGEIRQLLDAGLETVTRMRVLVDSLLRFTEAVEDGVQLSELDMNVLVQEVCGDMQADIAAAGAQVTVDSLPVIAGNPLQIRMLVQNLLGNAIKYRASGRLPQVRISAPPADTDGWNLLQVADNGIGIPEGEAENIFGMFKRLHVYDEYPGSGLGLSLCRRIVFNHGGRIWTVPTSGGGATFIAKLPVRSL